MVVLRWWMVPVAAGACLLLFAVGVQAQTTHDVSIQGNSFSPGSLTVQPGDTIRWTNQDGFPHGVDQTGGPTTFFAPELDSGGNGCGMAQNDDYSFTVPMGTAAGTYTYGCGCHPSMTASFTVPAPNNDPPAADAFSFSTPEDTAYSGTLTGSDPDGDSLTFAKVSDADHGTVTVSSGGSFTYTPASDYAGSDAFTFKVDDGQEESPAATVSITVTPVNDPPTAASHSFAVQSGVAHSGTLPAGSDPDHEADSLTYALVSSTGAHGTVSVQDDGSFTYQSESGYAGGASFTYRVEDPGGAQSAAATVSITVTAEPPANQPPVAQNAKIDVAPGGSAHGQLPASDPDGDALTFAIVDQPTQGDVDLDEDAGTFVYTAQADATGEDTFTFQVTDGELQSNVATLTVHLEDNGAAVTASPSSHTVGQDDTLTGSLDGSGDGTESLVFALVTSPSHGTATVASSGGFSYTPDPGFHGEDTFTFSVSQGSASATATITITVTPANRLPAVTDSSVTTDAGTEVGGALDATDDDGDPLTFSIVTPPAHGSVSLDGAAFTYIPESGFHGTDQFTWAASDGGEAQEATVTVTVAPVDDDETGTDASTEGVDTDASDTQDSPVAGVVVLSLILGACAWSGRRR